MDNLHNAWAGLSDTVVDPKISVYQPKRIIYSNSLYDVVTTTDGMGYKVVNRVTGMCEGDFKTLPSAITQADVTRDVLKRILDEKEANETSD